MSRTPLVAGAVFCWLAQLLLLSHALDALPAGLRVALAFSALVLAPGFAFVAAGGVPPAGGWLAKGWALGFGVAWNALLLLITLVLHRPFTVWAVGTAITTPLLWLVLAPRIRRAAPVAPAAWTRGTLTAVALAAALGAWHAGREGAPLGYVTDSPDHIGTVRRMLASGDPFPRDAFFKDAGPSGEDPRKGLWHPQVALVSRLAGTDPLVTWRWLPLILVPLFVLNVAGLGWAVRGAPGAAVAAWALLLTYGGSFANQYLREAVFSTKLGDQLMVATVVAALADLERRERRTRLATIALGLAAIATHVWYALALAIALGALGLGLALSGADGRARARRLLASGALLALAALPWLLWRASRQYAPVNPIHTAPQGMLMLARGISVMSVGVLWDWLGWWWVLIPFAIPALWREGRTRAAVLYLATTTMAVAALLYLPPLVALLRPRLGYLLLRTVWMVPVAGFLAWLVVSAWEAARHGPRRGRARLVLGVVALFALPQAAAMADALIHAPRYMAEERDHSPARWADALAWMDAHLPPGRVVLTDPLTAYSIPMTTRHYVTLLLDQHSSPDDPRALDRIFDARNALDPYASWDTTRAVVARYGADIIALNDRFADRPVLVYWGPRHDWYLAARARLDAAPAAFERVFDRGDFVVYRIHRESLDTLRTPPPPRPFVRRYDPARDGVARAMGEHLPALQELGLERRVVAPGDTLRGVIGWRAIETLPRGSYLVSVRLDHALPGGLTPPRVLAKPVRKVIEKLARQHDRFRGDHLPVGGDYGVDLWRPGEIVADSFAVVVPRDAAEGDWTLRVRLIAQAPYPNYRLSDYFFDDDYYSGPVVSWVRVSRNPRAPGPLVPPAGSDGGH